MVVHEAGFIVRDASLRWLPHNTVEITDPEQMRSLLPTIDTLEFDDVQNVTANFEMAEELNY